MSHPLIIVLMRFHFSADAFVSSTMVRKVRSLPPFSLQALGFGWHHQNTSPTINIAAYSSLPSLSSRRHKAEQKILKCSKRFIIFESIRAENVGRLPQH